MPCQIALAATVIGASSIVMAVTTGVAPAQDPGSDPLSALVRRTSHGVVHVQANSHGGLGYGYGYTFAQDNICVAADEFVTLSGERAKYFGTAPPGLGNPLDRSQGTHRDAVSTVRIPNVQSDFFWRWVHDSNSVENLLSQPPPRGPEPEVRVLVKGYVAGWNRYLRDVGVGNLPDPSCRGAPWVREITEIDIYRRIYQVTLWVGTLLMKPAILAASPPYSLPPSAARLPAELPPMPDRQSLGAGSNGVALGSDASSTGSGVVLVNPHFAWAGTTAESGASIDRLHQLHYTIPGQLDVAGVTFYGLPFIVYGHNSRVAWTFTFDYVHHFALVELRLASGRPTAYVRNGEVREMGQRRVTVQARNNEGSLTEHSKIFYLTEFGPVVATSDTPWTTQWAYVLADPNASNFRFANQMLAMARATDVAELEKTEDRYVGMPSANTVAADAAGRAYYADHAVVPHVTDDKLTSCAGTSSHARNVAERFIVLDGSRVECDLGTDEDAPVPGIFGPRRMPKLVRSDYVRNTNDSYWLANPRQPLSGYAKSVYGQVGQELPLRARLSIKMLEEHLGAPPSGTTISPDQLQQMTLNNRNYAGELVRDDLVDMCDRDRVVLSLDGPVDVSEACPVLEAWDLRANLDSAGAILFRQFWVGESEEPGKTGGAAFAGGSFRTWKKPFDPEDPVNTPNTLDTDDLSVRSSFGSAVARLRRLGIPLNASLRDYQFRNDVRLPVHGGSKYEGIFNPMVTWLRPPVGYVVAGGNSFSMIVAFTKSCPDVRSILPYSQSSNPTSPHFQDQTEMFEKKEWVNTPFCERDIAGDRNLVVTSLRER